MAEEIKRVLLEHPEILVEVLTARPQIIYEALAKLTPWERLATREDIEILRKEVATKEDLKSLEAKMATKEDLKTLATKEELKALVEKMATKEDLKTLATREELKALEDRMSARFDAVDREIRKLALRIDALGARWGLASEDAFREGVRELLREAGYAVEKWTYLDSEGYVHGYPSEVELDVVKNGVVIAVEITSALKRGDLPIIKRKTELYEQTTGRKVDKIYAITPFIHDKNPALVVAAAQRMGIQIIKPEEDVTRIGPRRLSPNWASWPI